MIDLISRQAAITLPVLPKEYREYQTLNLDDAYEKGWMDCQECIEGLPSAEPKHGKWSIEISNDGYQATYRCGECGHQFKWIYSKHCPPVFNFCQKCGARMEDGKID